MRIGHANLSYKPTFTESRPAGPRLSPVLLDIAERSMHASGSEWLFFREVRA